MLSLALLMACAIFSCQSPNGLASEALPTSSPSSQPAASSYRWQLPEGFPQPLVPEGNPMTEAKVELGRHLFYDKRLSLDGSMSCASCHEQQKAFSDGKAVPSGVTGKQLSRNSMALFNLAYTPVLTWANPQLKHLETQMLIPLFGEDPPELGLVGQEQALLERLAALPLYQQLFQAAFPDKANPFTLQQLTEAIASFERSLVSADSPYDRYVYGGDDNAISAAAKRGEALFFSERLECFHCHGGFNFSDSVQHAGSAFEEFNFHNTGLYNLDGKGAYPADNTGLHDLTHRPEDMGKFKAPSLRNIAVTAPYMHDGSVASLDEVIDHYAAGGRTLSTGPYAGKGADSPYKSGFVKGFQLSPAERADLKAFLNSLTDESFLNNPAYAAPAALTH